MSRWLDKIKVTMLYKKALKLVKKELFREASGILEKALKLNPESAQILVVLGFSYMRIADEFKDDEETMNSWVTSPPIAPESASTAPKVSPQRLKIRVSPGPCTCPRWASSIPVNSRR